MDTHKSAWLKSLFSGLVPAVLLMIFVWLQLGQTNSQLKILQEQISYVRKPVLVLNNTPDHDSDDFTYRLSISNVGNETAENVYVRYFLFLVTDKQVYSYGQYEYHRAYFSDTTRTPREKLWPRLTLKPNSEDKRIHKNLKQACFKPFLELTEEDDYRRELFEIQSLLKGQYVLFTSIQYRDKTDLILHADTVFFAFHHVWGPFVDLRSEIGGTKVIERIKKYLSEGPQMSINIKRDNYEIYEHTLRTFTTSISKVAKYPRKK